MSWATHTMHNCVKGGCMTDMWHPREDTWYIFPNVARVHKDMPLSALWYVSYAALEQHRMVIILLTSTSHEKLFVPFRCSCLFDPSDTQRSNFLDVGPISYVNFMFGKCRTKGIRWATKRIWCLFEGLNLSWCTSGILSFDYNQGSGWFGSKQCSDSLLHSRPRERFFWLAFSLCLKLWLRWADLWENSGDQCARLLKMRLNEPKGTWS